MPSELAGGTMLSVSSSEVGEGGQIEEEKWAVRGPKGKIHGRAFQSIPHMWRASVSSFTLWTLFLLLLPVCLLCSAELVLCSRWESSSELCFKQMGGFWSSWERGSLLQMNFGAVHCSVNADGPHGAVDLCICISGYLHWLPVLLESLQAFLLWF